MGQMIRSYGTIFNTGMHQPEKQSLTLDTLFISDAGMQRRCNYLLTAMNSAMFAPLKSPESKSVLGVITDTSLIRKASFMWSGNICNILTNRVTFSHHNQTSNVIYFLLTSQTCRYIKKLQNAERIRHFYREIELIDYYNKLKSNQIYN